MLLELENAVVNRLKALGIPASAWSGDRDELFKRPKYLPSARTVIERLNFTRIDHPSYQVKATLSIILFFRSLRDEASGAYPILRNILSALSSKTLAGYILRPQNLELLYHESGEFAYRLSFDAEGMFIVPQEPEPVTVEITVEDVS